MQRRIIKPAIAIVLVLALGIVGIMMITGKANTLFHDTAESTKALAANVFIDINGYKQQAADALTANREMIAEATGMSLDQVDRAISDIDIEKWEACALPSDASAVTTYNADYAGMSGTVTTYQDPNYITVNTSGQSVTLAVPPSAQDYIPYLMYLSS